MNDNILTAIVAIGFTWYLATPKPLSITKARLIGFHIPEKMVRQLTDAEAALVYNFVDNYLNEGRIPPTVLLNQMRDLGNKYNFDFTNV